MTDEKDALAHAWDVGYDAALAVTEAGILRLAIEGSKALGSMKRATNPYRIIPPVSTSTEEAHHG